MVGIVALVGECCPGLEAFDELMGEGDVVALSGAGDQADRIAQFVATT